MRMKEKLKMLIKNLNTGLVGKEDVIKTSLLSVLAQENLVLFGPPGTAKSEISRRISGAIDTGNYFEYLLTKFTTPEEIFGPLSIKELKEDRFYRKTDGYLPTAQIGFLDEIFKANSSILNTLLTIMNEKVFHNGNKKENANLISLIGASNEDPSDDSELNALYDRFLIRKVVEYVQEEELNKFFDISGEKFVMDKNLKITLKEIEKIEENLTKIIIPNDIREIILKIKSDLKNEFKNNNQEDISDRKFMKILKLLKISAYTNERNQVDISDILLLKNCLWNNPENQKRVSDIIINNIKAGHEIVEISNENKIFEVNNKKSLNQFDFKGTGTESDPFIIEDENDLIHIGTTDYLDKGYYFKQSKDIEIASHWHSIGSEEKPFKGNYDGNNKSITKLNNALFFKIKDSDIKNLSLNEVNIDVKLIKTGSIANISSNSYIRNCYVDGSITTATSSSYSYAGGIVGYISGGKIENCSVNCSIASSASSAACSYAGGIAGSLEGGKIENCSVNGSITSTTSAYSYSSYAGGVTGHSEGGKIENCSVNSSITSSASSYSYAGGVAGYSKGGKIENCSVNSSITSSAACSYGGGAAGHSEGGIIENCSVNGNITSSASYSSSSHTGGIAGSFGEKCAFRNNYIDGGAIINKNKINSSDEHGANGKSLVTSMFNEKFYRRLGWDFEKVWSWNKNNNTPILRQRNNMVNNTMRKIPMKKNELSNILNNNIWI